MKGLEDEMKTEENKPKQLKRTYRKSKNIFIISIDALRADHVGCLGYNKRITPNIDKLSREGILFKKAIAPGSYTFLSFPSFMTSLYPSEYYIRQGHVDTIAFILKKYGYKTVSFNSNPYATGKLDKGFDYFDDLMNRTEFNKPQEKLKRRIVKKLGNQNKFINFSRKIFTMLSADIARPYAEAERMNEAAFEFLEKNKEEPLFFWMHYMDTHYPFLPPSDFTNFSKQEIIRYNRIYNMLTHANKKSKKDVTEEEIMKIISLYDNQIKYVDTYIGEFFKKLKKLDLYDDSLIILFSDHGELFGEYGEFGHLEYNVYYKQLHVPLILKGSDSKTHVINHPVALKDLPQTILHSLGIKYSNLKEETLIDKQYGFIISEGFDLKEVFFESKLDLNKINYSCIFNNWQFIYNSLKNKKELYNLKDGFGNNNFLEDSKKEVENLLYMIVENHKKKISKIQEIKMNVRELVMRRDNDENLLCR